MFIQSEYLSSQNNSNEQDEEQHNVILETPMTKEAMNRSGTDRLYRLEEPDTKRSKEDKKSKKKKDKKDKVCISIYKFLYNISRQLMMMVYTVYNDKCRWTFLEIQEE